MNIAIAVALLILLVVHIGKQYNWKCELGHTWSASPNSRVSGRGCPYCAGKAAGRLTEELYKREIAKPN